MALRYESIEFDTVEELLEYKKKVEGVKVKEKELEPVSVTSVDVIERASTRGTDEQYKKIIELTKGGLTKSNAIKGVLGRYPNGRDYTIINRMLVNGKIGNPSLTGKGSQWTAIEDDVLRKAIEFNNGGRIGKNMYKAISKKLPGRTKYAIKARVKVIKGSINKKISNSKWSKNEVQMLKEFYGRYKGALPRGSITELRKLFPGRTDGAIRVRANSEGFTRKAGHMIRDKPLTPKTFDDRMIDTAKKSAKPVEDFSFPKIYPLAERSHKMFEQMLVDMIARKGKISMFDAQTALELQDDKEWCGRVWAEFVSQVNIHIGRLRKVLVMESPRLLRTVKEGGYDYISYG